MNLITNVIGYAGTIVGTLLMLPQVIQSFKTKKVNDISLTFVIMYVLNCALWLTYGILIHAYPVIITNAVALVTSFVQLYLKIKHHTR